MSIYLTRACIPESLMDFTCWVNLTTVVSCRLSQHATELSFSIRFGILSAMKYKCLITVQYLAISWQASSTQSLVSVLNAVWLFLLLRCYVKYNTPLFLTLQNVQVIMLISFLSQALFSVWMTKGSVSAAASPPNFVLFLKYRHRKLDRPAELTLIQIGSQERISTAYYGWIQCLFSWLGQ